MLQTWSPCCCYCFHSCCSPHCYDYRCAFIHVDYNENDGDDDDDNDGDDSVDDDDDDNDEDDENDGNITV